MNPRREQKEEVRQKRNQKFASHDKHKSDTRSKGVGLENRKKKDYDIE